MNERLARRNERRWRACPATASGQRRPDSSVGAAGDLLALVDAIGNGGGSGVEACVAVDVEYSYRDCQVLMRICPASCRGYREAPRRDSLRG